MASECRFYEGDLPEIQQLVMVRVEKVTETCAYVSLIEYANLEGMIQLAEVATRRIRSMLKEIRAGHFCVCVVMKVDKDKKHVDLSRKKVDAKQRAGFLQTYGDSKTVHSVLRQLSTKHEIPLIDLCAKISWPLYKKYPHAKDAFKQYAQDNDDAIFKDLGVEGELLESLTTTIKRRLTPTAVKLKAKIKVCCFEEKGIFAVREALSAGLGANKAGDKSLEIKVVASPQYDVVTTSMSKTTALAKIHEVLAIIKEKIEADKGIFEVLEQPVEEADLVEEENADSSSESDSDESDEEVVGMGNIDVEGA